MRFSLFEFEDQEWFPKVLRDYQTGFLAFFARHGQLYEAVPVLLQKEAVSSIADLASGAGDAAVLATAGLRDAGATLILSDKFPNIESARLHNEAMGVNYILTSVDVCIDPLPAAESYTMFNAFHHFSTSEQIDLLQKIKASGAPLHIFEPLQRNVFTFIKVLLATSLGPLLFTPFIRPFTWSRILFTYILPVGILVTMWDGLVSVLRSLSARQRQLIMRVASAKGIRLEYRSLPSPFARITYLRAS